MRFGAFLPQGWRIEFAGIPLDEHWPTMLAVATDFESLHFDSLWVHDHFHSMRGLVRPNGRKSLND